MALRRAPQACYCAKYTRVMRVRRHPKDHTCASGGAKKIEFAAMRKHAAVRPHCTRHIASPGTQCCMALGRAPLACCWATRARHAQTRSSARASYPPRRVTRHPVMHGARLRATSVLPRKARASCTCEGQKTICVQAASQSRLSCCRTQTCSSTRTPYPPCSITRHQVVHGARPCTTSMLLRKARASCACEG